MASIAVALLPACRPNPRNEIAEIAGVAMEEIARTAPGRRLCVGRVITPWQPAHRARRIDPPAPPGYEDVYADPSFTGGGGIRGGAVGGVPVGTTASCFELRGPVVEHDRAMVEVYRTGVGYNVWQRRIGGVWRVTTVTTSVYMRS